MAMRVSPAVLRSTSFCEKLRKFTNSLPSTPTPTCAIACFPKRSKSIRLRSSVIEDSFVDHFAIHKTEKNPFAPLRKVAMASTVFLMGFLLAGLPTFGGTAASSRGWPVLETLKAWGPEIAVALLRLLPAKDPFPGLGASGGTWRYSAASGWTWRYSGASQFGAEGVFFGVGSGIYPLMFGLVVAAAAAAAAAVVILLPRLSDCTAMQKTPPTKSQVAVEQSIRLGEKCFNPLSNEERGKSDAETDVNVNSIVRQKTTNQRSKGFSYECNVVVEVHCTLQG